MSFMPGIERNDKLSKAFLTEHSNTLDDDEDDIRTIFKEHSRKPLSRLAIATGDGGGGGGGGGMGKTL